MSAMLGQTAKTRTGKENNNEENEKEEENMSPTQ